MLDQVKVWSLNRKRPTHNKPARDKKSCGQERRNDQPQNSKPQTWCAFLRNSKERGRAGASEMGGGEEEERGEGERRGGGERRRGREREEYEYEPRGIILQNAHVATSPRHSISIRSLYLVLLSCLIIISCFLF